MSSVSRRIVSTVTRRSMVGTAHTSPIVSDATSWYCRTADRMSASETTPSARPRIASANK